VASDHDQQSLIAVPFTAPDSALRLMATGPEYDSGSSPHAASGTNMARLIIFVM
jgi:hypothetical protein